MMKQPMITLLFQQLFILLLLFYFFSGVKADCGESSAVQDFLQFDLAIRAKVLVGEFGSTACLIQITDDSGTGAYMETNQNIMQIQVLEIFHSNGDNNNAVVLDDILTVVWDTDTGLRQDLPSDLVDSGEDGFLAMLSKRSSCPEGTNDVEDVFYALNECNFDTNKPWSSLSKVEVNILRGVSVVNDSVGTVVGSSGSSSGGDNNMLKWKYILFMSTTITVVAIISIIA